MFVRLALNPEIFIYEPRGSMRIVNWYLYTYLICRGRDVRGRMVAVDAPTIASLAGLPRPRTLLPAAR